MLVEQAHQLIGVEELARDVAREPFLHHGVVALLAQPIHDRHGEAELLLLRPVLRDGELRSVAQCELRLLLVGLERRGDGGRQVEYAAVEEGHARFERMRHRHFVGLEQDVSHQPEVQIDVLHARRLVEIGNLGIHGRCERLRGGGAAAALEQACALLGCEGDAVRVGVVPVLRRLACALKIVRAAQMKRAHRIGCALEQALRRPAYLRVGERRLVDSIASEELIGTFSGKHGLHLGGGNLVDEVQRHGGRVGGGLVHVPLHARKARPVFLLADVLVGIGDM